MGGLPCIQGEKEVGFVVVNAQERAPQNEREGLGRLEPHQQGARQTRALGGGHRFDLGRAHVGLAQRGARHRQQVAKMFARRQLRHHTAIFGVQSHLGGYDVGQHPPVVRHGRAGLVARSFESQEHLLPGLPAPTCSVAPRAGSAPGRAKRVEGDALEQVHRALQLRVAERSGPTGGPSRPGFPGRWRCAGPGWRYPHRGSTGTTMSGVMPSSWMTLWLGV